MIVVDASAVLEILKQTPKGTELNGLLAGRLLAAPHLIDLEVASVLRRWVSRREMTAAEAERALDAFLGLPLNRFGHAPLMGSIWGMRNKLTPYDAAYAVLADMLKAELVTCDGGQDMRSKRPPA